MALYWGNVDIKVHNGDRRISRFLSNVLSILRQNGNLAFLGGAFGKVLTLDVFNETRRMVRNEKPIVAEDRRRIFNEIHGASSDEPLPSESSSSLVLFCLPNLVLNEQCTEIPS